MEIENRSGTVDYYNQSRAAKTVEGMPWLRTPRAWLNANRALFVNAGSLVGTTVVTSALGFVYWWLAARLFPPEAVGFASSAISAMMLLGAVGMLGLGTLLIGELPRNPGKAGSMIVAALVLAGAASAVLGILYAVAAPGLSPELAGLSISAANIFFFAAGVVLTAVTLIVDQALIGLLRGGLQLGRNTFFAVAKLALLYLASLWLSSEAGINIYITWMVGNLLSLVALAAYMVIRGIRIHYVPEWTLFRTLKRAALAHHAVNLILQAPSLIMPIAVTTLLSASSNASFYAAWMVVSFAFVIPSHLATVLYAVGASQPAVLMDKLRTTMRWSLLAAVPMSVGLFLTAGILLNLFGGHYAEQAEWCLRILSLGVFPLIVKYHYVALRRVYNRLETAVVLFFFGSALEIVFVVVGLKLGELTGLSIGWLVAVSIEAAYMYYRLSQEMSAQGAVVEPRA